MGGHALKNTLTRRYSKEEYENIVEEITSKLPYTYHIPTPFSNKDSFGDLDVLILSEENFGRNDMAKFIKYTFNPNEMYRNSDVISFDYKEFQIDFIKVSKNNWETSKIYFSYNDLGNFMGRIAYKMGFRYGDFGLRLVYLHENGGRKFKMVVSKEPEKIFTFLGFDWKKYQKGFDSLSEIFNFVVESKYFNARLFDYDQLNHQNKTRNKKRINYGKFLEHVASISKRYEYEDKDTYVKMAENFFGIDIVEQIAIWRKSIELEKEANERFNGNIIMKLFPELNGKELGLAIMNFKSYVIEDVTEEFVMSDYEPPKHMFSNWINTTDQETIWNTFKTVNNL